MSAACITNLVRAARAMGHYIPHEYGSALEEEDHKQSKGRLTRMPSLVSTDSFTAADLSQNLALLIT